MPLALYEHQLDALSRMKNGCILCGGVGSGKSLTSLAYFYLQNGGSQSFLTGGEHHYMNNPPKDLYIITTARKRDTLEWEKELCYFLMSPSQDVSAYSHTVVIDSWNNIRKYENCKESFFIFDEQRVIGKGSWVKSFLKLAKANLWILLSATPGDTWQDYIPVFVANGFFKNRSEFVNEHIIYSQFTKFPKIDRYQNTGRLSRLRSRILIDMDFDRETVPHHEDIFVSYDKELFNYVTRTRWNPYENKPIINAAELCYIWRRIVNRDSSRQMALLELLEKHKRAIIFYNFDYELEILKNLGYDDSIKIAEWNGHKHQPIPENQDWVYLVQYTAGCEGWNCVKTDTIIFYSQNYSYKVMTQAAGRIDRLNTPYVDLYFYHLKCRSGIDLAISKALIQKKSFNEAKYAKW
jgi:hypothetical protein